MSQCQMCVVRGFFVVSRLMVLCRLAVMPRSVCVMFGCVFMVFGRFR